MRTVPSSLVHTIAPQNGPAKSLFPTLILLHGRGATEEDLLGLAPYFPPQFLVIAARAPFPFSYGGATWYEILSTGTPHPGQFGESFEKLVQFVRDIKTHYPVDPKRLFFLGFSMGTVMSYAFALTHPEDVSGVVAHSGYVPEDTSLVFEWEKLKGKGFFVAHGTQDPVIGIQFAHRAKGLLEKTEAEVTYREYPIPHSMSEESVGEFSAWLGQRMQGGS
jgi:phospholipase/carboxylesterase